MKVLHLISSGGMYGAETMLVNLATAQERLGCQVVLGVFLNRQSPHVEVGEAARANHLAVETIPCRGRVDKRTVKAIRDYIREHEVHVVHTHGWKSDIYGYLAAKPLSMPIIATCHLWTRKTLAVRVYELLDSIVMRDMDRVVAVSDAIAQTLRSAGIPETNILTVNNGTNFADHCDATPSLRLEMNCGQGPLIGTVGRLNKQKGIEYFLEAAREIADQFPAARFVVVGEGPERPRLEALIRKLRLQDRAFLLGERQDMPGVYASLDVFVLASVDEGMPMTILEALAARKPVVATRVGAVEKLVIPEQTGLLVEARNVPALRDAVLRCLENPAHALSLGRGGAQHVRARFSAEGMARNYLEVYEQVLRERGVGAATSLQEV